MGSEYFDFICHVHVCNYMFMTQTNRLVGNVFWLQSLHCL